jgi:hypothetical protein
MPKCNTCHGQTHGPDLLDCMTCHDEPHAPKIIAADRYLEGGCSVCHPEADKEMKTYITQHTELYCVSCHYIRHRQVPQCSDCHQPHEEGQTQAQCLACHPPHSALQVVYDENIASEACRGCHRTAYDVLKSSHTKHAALSCAKCHTRHKLVASCDSCHPNPHPPEMLKSFRVCGQCHGIAHSLRK